MLDSPPGNFYAWPHWISTDKDTMSARSNLSWSHSQWLVWASVGLIPEPEPSQGQQRPRRPRGGRGCAVRVCCNSHGGSLHPCPAAAIRVPVAINPLWLQLSSPERWGVPLEDFYSLPMPFIEISVVIEAGPPCLRIYSQIKLQNQSSRPVSATC